MDNLIEKLCRLCLSKDGELELISQEGKSDLCERIFECTRIEVGKIHNFFPKNLLNLHFSRLLVLLILSILYANFANQN